MSAQRYSTDLAHARMELGLCPECGEKASSHSADPRFWVRPGSWCDPLPHGVEERIEQYRADRGEANQ